MLLSSDQQVLLRTWFAQTRADHDRVQPYDVPNLPGRCRLDDAKRLSGLLEQAFQAVVVPGSACLDTLLDPYLLDVRSWAESCTDSAASGDDGSSEHVDSLSAAVRAFVATLGSLEVQAHNARSVINRLVPDDVFFLIFGLLSFKDRLAVASVCHHWREVALACTSLWTDLTLYENGFGRSVCLRNPWLSQLIQRSKSAPLSLTAANARRQSMTALSSCLAASLNRITSLDISFSSGVRFRDTWFDALRQPAPFLDYLRLNSGRRRCHDDVDSLIPIPADLFAGHAPLLRTVYLGTLNLPASCPAFAQVRVFCGHFAERQDPALAQDRQTQLVYELFPQLDYLDLCYIEDAEVLPALPARLALKKVFMNSRLTEYPSYYSGDVHRAVSGIGDLARVQFAKALGGDTAAVMGLWCNPLPPWRTVRIDHSLTELSLATISVQCGTDDTTLKTRVFVLHPQYLSSAPALRAQINTRMVSVSVCVLDAKAFFYYPMGKLLHGAMALEKLHIVLDDGYEDALRVGSFSTSSGILTLPALKRVGFRVPSDWKLDRPVAERALRVRAADLAAFLQKHIAVPQLETIVVSRGLTLDDPDELSHGLTNFTGSILIQ